MAVFHTLKSIGYSLYRQTMAIIIIALLNYPLTYTISREIKVSNTSAIIFGVTISLLFAFSVFIKSNYAIALITGILAGYLLNLLTWAVNLFFPLEDIIKPDILISYYNLGILIATTPVILFSVMLVFRRSDHRNIKTLLAFTIILALVVVVFRLFTNFNYQNAFVTHTEIINRLILGLLVGIIMVGLIHGFVVKSISTYEKLSAYLKVMLKPVIAFFLGYIAIMISFAGFYGIAYYFDNQAFNNLHNDRLIDFVYYSFSIITGLGFSTIEPESASTMFLTGLEDFFGLVWVTVVFAATLAYLQEPFKKLRK